MRSNNPGRVHPLVLQIYKLFNKDLVEKYEFLRIQLEIATENRGKRFRFTERQRCKLVQHGLPVKEHLDALCKIMKPGTLLKWHRDQKMKKWDYSARREMKVRSIDIYREISLGSERDVQRSGRNHRIV